MTDKELHRLAFKALKSAIRNLRKESIRTGRPLIIWDKGKVVKLYLKKKRSK